MVKFYPQKEQSPLWGKGKNKMKSALITLGIVVAALVIDRKLVQKFI
jgi:hypothetical protein